MSSNNLKLHIADRHKAIILDILQSTCPKHNVWAYGSRVGGYINDNIYEGSDLDLVILGDNPPIYELKQLFAECNVPHIIDIVAWETLQNFQQEIKKKYVVLYSPTKRKNHSE